MVMRPDVLSNNGILLVANNSDITEWTFTSVSEDKYYINTTVDGTTKYLTINGNNVTLTDEPDPVYSVIKATPGTGENAGKWVRYDKQGKMIKGWYTVQGADAELYPDQVGNTYYYDIITGLMAKGDICIDNTWYHFNEWSGALEN